MTRKWDQQPGEPDQAFHYFKLWRDQSPKGKKTSKFVATLQSLGNQVDTFSINRYRCDYKWKERGQAYTQWIDQKAESRLIKELTLNRMRAERRRAKIFSELLKHAKQVVVEVRKQAIVASDAKAVNDTLDALKKAAELAGTSYLDQESQLRRLAARRPARGGKGIAGPTPEELLELSEQSDTVQSGDSEG